MTAIAGMPSRSAVTESCRLHDEQLPQSPISGDHRVPTGDLVHDVPIGRRVKFDFDPQDDIGEPNFREGCGPDG